MDNKIDFDESYNPIDEFLTTVVGAQILLKKPPYEIEKLVKKGNLRKIKDPFHRRNLICLSDIQKILNLNTDGLFELMKKERIPIIGQTNML